MPRSGNRKRRWSDSRFHDVRASAPVRYISWATAAATFGAEKLVPLQRAQPVNGPSVSFASSVGMKNVLITSMAGAHASTQPPKLVNHALSACPRPPTPTTSGSAAGKYGRDDDWLPAAA